jgi:hypothetical protein
MSETRKLSAFWWAIARLIIVMATAWLVVVTAWRYQDGGNSVNATHLIVLALTVLGYLGPHFMPALLLRHSKKLSLRELAEVHPSLAWMRSEWAILEWATIVAPIISYLFYIPFGAFVAVLLLVQLGLPERYFVGALGASAAIPNGFFAIATGVCPVLTPTRRYLYV